ncbi:MAG: hypothetical protein ABIO86_01230 [Sphingomonas sp.]
MKIEMLAAKNGDCLILHCGPEANPRIILIDGGPTGVWKSSLEPRLMQLRAARGLDDETPLVIDLLIISHVDDDHINGVLGLLGAMLDRKQRGDPPLFRIERLWHNSFDNILGNDETVATIRSGSAQFGAASTEAESDEALAEFEAGDPRDAAFVLASIEQGDNVRRLAGALNIPLNPDFGGKLLQTVPGNAATIAIGDVELTIAGPRHGEVVALQKAHDDWLKKHPERQADADAILASLDDESVANLSSIVILARSADKSLLLTGDARADNVLKGLEDCGAIAPGAALALDVLKMPHHGSIRNIDGPTMSRLPAKHYLFSGNGKFSNPDRESFELLFEVRPGAAMDFVLPYDLKEIDEARKREREKQIDSQRKKGKPENPPWDEAKHSLSAILSPPPVGVRVTESSGITIEVTP